MVILVAIDGYSKKVEPCDLEMGKTSILDLGLSKDTIYIDLTLKGSNLSSDVFLTISNISLDYIELSDVKSGLSQCAGQNIFPNNLGEPTPTFKVQLGRTYLVKVLGDEQILLPMTLKSILVKSRDDWINTLIQGVFIGLIVALLFYNAFLFFFLRESTYLIYVLFLFFIGLAQFHLLGINYYLIGRYSNLYPVSFQLFSALAGIFGVVFTEKFLELTKRLTWSRFIVVSVVFLYALVPVLLLFGQNALAFRLLQIGAMSFLYILAASYILAIRNYNSAIYFSVAWTVFIGGLILFVLKDFGVVPVNNFSKYTMTFGVSVAAIVLSIALADRINILNREKEESNSKLVTETKKNEELVLNQNITLEQKVIERTGALQQALDDLKSTQSQLVQSEKMASLGTLTAGIAHEINNPINFVSANVIPLRENINDITKLIAAYKSIDFSKLKSELKRLAVLEEELELDYMLTETKQLIDGIEEGAKRTHTIVEGLTSFSRGDMVKKSKSDVNRGIRSTISVLKSRLNNVKLITSLDKNLPLLSCQVGKINQVVLNLMNNALDALEEKNGSNKKVSELMVETKDLGHSVQIIISDNANGIEKELQRKIMEPFYTTKEVGKGTGLGLSISYSIIEDHGGAIEIDSEMGVGTKFIVTLPLVSYTSQ